MAAGNMLSPAVALAGLAACAGLMLLAWALSVPRRDVSIVDAFWGPNLLVAGLAYAATAPAVGPRAALVLALTAIWAFRLSLHIVRRNRGQPEDRRYRAMRERRGPGFWWQSLFVVFLLQAVLAWIISAPLLAAVTGSAPLGWLDFAGAALWVFGFGFETIADRQLAAFIAGPGRTGAVMDRGLWAWSRHPNYFGECCLWWGVGLLGLAAGAWWSLIGPALLTFFLLRVSGVALTEKDIAQRRPAYQDYIRRTSAFLPRPPRR